MQMEFLHVFVQRGGREVVFSPVSKFRSNFI